MATLSRLILLGAGGHASDVLGVVEAVNERRPTFDLVGLLDDNPNADMSRFKGRNASLLGGVDHLMRLDAFWIIAVGWPRPRRRIIERAVASGRPPATLLSPTADIGAGVMVGVGSVIMGAARMSPRSQLGEHAVVSYMAAVGHDASVGDGALVMPGAMVSGEVKVGAGVLVGTNATIIEGVRVGEGATIGAGAVVLDDVEAGTTVAGVPARLVSR